MTRSLLTRECVDRYLTALKELGRDVSLVDLHVHAAEIIHGRIRYRGDARNVLVAEGSTDRRPVSAGDIKSLNEDLLAGVSAPIKVRLSEMAFDRSFGCSGASVLAEHMDLCGFSRSLLLPVASDAVPIEPQLKMLSEIVTSSDRFIMAYSFPANVPHTSIASRLDAEMQIHNISAIKLHPNITGVDIGTDRGRQHVEAVLEAAGSRRLPVICHGGCSPIFGDSAKATYSVAENLQKIDWSATSHPVVIAHFGIYGCESGQLRLHDLDRMKTLLQHYDHLYLDTSGLDPGALLSVLPQVDLQRVVFGSDALYLPLWQVAASVCHALKAMHGGTFPDHFAKIAHAAPMNVLAG